MDGTGFYNELTHLRGLEKNDDCRGLYVLNNVYLKTLTRKGKDRFYGKWKYKILEWI